MTSNDIIKNLENYYIEIEANNGGFIHLFGPVRFPISTDGMRTEEYNWYVWDKSSEHMSFDNLLVKIKNKNSFSNYDSILTYGYFESAEKALVRVHSCCFAGDIAFSTRCDCGQQLKSSFELISKNGSGAVAYLANHEGRGIGLYAKAITHKIQDDYNLDTFKSCTTIGFDDERRNFSDLGVIFNYLRKNKGVVLLSNNPEKINGLLKGGMKIDAIQPLVGFENKDNIKGLTQKRKRARSYSYKLQNYKITL